jgi:hypothetical protein
MSILSVIMRVSSVLLAANTLGMVSAATFSGSSSDVGVAVVGPVKVFILAGQSNMVGMGSIDHLDLLVSDETTNPEFRDALWDGSAYKERDDVLMKYDLNHGNLTVSRTSGYAGKNSFGPELMFGWTVGDARISERVLLVKTAWGGKSLAVDFRPPSAGEGNYSGVKPIQYGYFYRAMIMDVMDTLSNLGNYVPDYDESAGYELAGFVWFQGWNDMLNYDTVNEYGPNLVKFIRDVRLDLDEPDLPFSMFSVLLTRHTSHHTLTTTIFLVHTVLLWNNVYVYLYCVICIAVIGELGMSGMSPEGKGSDRILALRAAQHSVTLLEEFQNTTLFVRTAPYAVLNGTNYNGIYHYNGRADTYFHIGQGLDEACCSYC